MEIQDSLFLVNFSDDDSQFPFIIFEKYRTRGLSSKQWLVLPICDDEHWTLWCILNPFRIPRRPLPEASEIETAFWYYDPALVGKRTKTQFSDEKRVHNHITNKSSGVNQKIVQSIMNYIDIGSYILQDDKSSSSSDLNENYEERCKRLSQGYYSQLNNQHLSITSLHAFRPKAISDVIFQNDDYNCGVFMCFALYDFCFNVAKEVIRLDETWRIGKKNTENRTSGSAYRLPTTLFSQFPPSEKKTKSMMSWHCQDFRRSLIFVWEILSDWCADNRPLRDPRPGPVRDDLHRRLRCWMRPQEMQNNIIDNNGPIQAEIKIGDEERPSQSEIDICVFTNNDGAEVYAELNVRGPEVQNHEIRLIQPAIDTSNCNNDGNDDVIMITEPEFVKRSKVQNQITDNGLVEAAINVRGPEVQNHEIRMIPPVIDTSNRNNDGNDDVVMITEPEIDKRSKVQNQIIDNGLLEAAINLIAQRNSVDVAYACNKGDGDRKQLPDGAVDCIQKEAKGTSLPSKKKETPITTSCQIHQNTWRK